MYEPMSPPFCLGFLGSDFCHVEPNESWLIQGLSSNFILFWIFSLNTWYKSAAYPKCLQYIQMGPLSILALYVSNQILLTEGGQGLSSPNPRALCILDAQKNVCGSNNSGSHWTPIINIISNNICISYVFIHLRERDWLRSRQTEYKEPSLI